MSLRSFASPLDLQLPFLPLKNPPLLRRSPRIREDLHPRKRRRRRRLLVVRSGAEDLFRSLISAFPSLNTLDLITPALGFASGAALYIASSSWHGSRPEADGVNEAVVGDWILYTSPTPFNRCVLLRCPSVSFEDGGELLDGVNERLVTEERHFVNLSRGRIPARKGGDGCSEGEISYQRVCVGTDDGGVISLDWPDNLEMGKEHGLDTTVLIVPGTAEGSMDRNVRMFVYDALMHGCFPIVMNPRGCAGSPLTTARLFTAADSDDICTAIQFINRLRPWTTLMSIGWGYGANMLTKYLAEVGETTSLTAAVCIDNPFDLEEATRSFPHHTAMDQKLTSGLIDILRANKELFQGKTKGFDVAKGLSATSIRDFDKAISMISYGFDGIDDFYSNTSTRQSVSSVKIPVLFIQSGDSAVPLFSVPRSSIAENPFTSLLLCSCWPSAIVISERSAILWCQHIAIEWLSAVEFALLKGRHPLLKDVDITINPSKGLAFVDDRASERSISTGSKIHGSYDPAQLFLSRKNANGDTFMKLTQSNSVNGFLINPLASVNENDGRVHDKFNSHSKLGSELHGMQRVEDAGTKQDKNFDVSQQSNILNASLAKGEEDSPIDIEGSKVLQTATVVMNMLDVTMPGTLDDERKKKVLTAMEQGETLMKALQEAVPEDVRGKLTTSVTEVLQTQGTNLNLDVLKRIGWIPNMTSEVKSRIQETFKGISTRESGYNDTNISDQRIKGAGSEGGTQDDDSAVLNSGNNSIRESTESSQGKGAQASGCLEAGSEEGGKPSQPDKFEKAGGDNDEASAEQYTVNQSYGVDDRHSAYNRVVVNDVQNNEGTKVNSVAEQNVPISSSNSEEAFLAGSSTTEHKAIEKEGNEIPTNDDKMIQDTVDVQNAQSSATKSEEPLPHDSSSKSPSISVTQALDALTGLDDSTQMAVNSVFGVLENMIDQYEKANNRGNDEEVNKTMDQQPVNASHDLPLINEDKSEKMVDNSNSSGVQSDVIQPSDQPENDFHGEASDSHGIVEGSRGENKVTYSLTSSNKYSISWSQENDRGIYHLDSTDTEVAGHVQRVPLDIALNPYWQSPYGTYFHRYLSAQLPKTKSFDSDSTTDLFLDPEEGQWKMPNQVGNTSSTGESGEKQSIHGKDQTLHSLSRQSDAEEIIEPSYIILDTEYSRLEHQSNEEYYTIDCCSREEDAKKEEFMSLIKNILLDSLKVEVGRRLGIPDLKELADDLVYDLEHVVDAVSQAIVCDNELNLNSFYESNGLASVKIGTVDGERIIKTITSAVQDANHLRKVLPVGVVVGSSLASLRKYFKVAALHDGDQRKAIYKPGNMQEKFNDQEGDIKTELCVDEKDHHADSDYTLSEDKEKIETDNLKNDGIMVGVVTAALGASALLAHHQHKKIYKQESMETPSGSSNDKGFPHMEPVKLEEAIQERNESSLVGSLAEKAMSVAGPVVPTKSDGEVDQERLVAILAELGQKGGILRLVGKLALLWGGVRGAMSLTDRLISFLRIAERPLFQRVLGFICMVLVLWSPVVIPLLPTLVQSWATKTSSGIAEYACIVGLYVAIMFLVMLWGKRIRGYDNPIEQYGLDLTSPPRVQEFIKGLFGGMMIVLCIHSINALLGYACLSWPPGLPSSSANAIMLLKAYGHIVLQAVRGIVTATGIAIVEELLFRSWLTEEVAVDFGYYRAVMISGVVFSIAQRSLPSIPGFFLLSLALFGIKQRAHGKLCAPVGTRVGIMTTNFVLRTGGFLTYQPGAPFWLTNTHLSHPFDGAVGLSFCAILAVVFSPRPPLQKKENLKGS